SPPPEEFKVDPALAAKGREYFSSLGCASCHSLKISGQLVASTKTAPAFASLKGQGGCLDDRPPKSPRYALSPRQKETLTTAIAAARQPAKVLSPGESVERMLVRFNCTACHDRNKLGGVEVAREPQFQSDIHKMGDEGRIPPSLTGVGAKLNPQWL